MDTRSIIEIAAGITVPLAFGGALLRAIIWKSRYWGAPDTIYYRRDAHPRNIDTGA